MKRRAGVKRRKAKSEYIVFISAAARDGDLVMDLAHRFKKAGCKVLTKEFLPNEAVDRRVRNSLHVREDEVDEVFRNRPHYRKIENGEIEGEDLYGAFGQTHAGRYLSVFFIYKLNHDALVISARDMNKSERRQYVKK